MITYQVPTVFFLVFWLKIENGNIIFCFASGNTASRRTVVGPIKIPLATHTADYLSEIHHFIDTRDLLMKSKG